jgi:hypothetical protein
VTTTSRPDRLVPPPPAEPNGTAARAASTPDAPRAAAAPRRWRPSYLIIATLLVLLGGLIAMWGARSLVHRDSVLVVARPVAVGSRIAAGDLATAEITSDPHLAPIAAAQRDAVIGQVALVDLTAGSLLTRSQIGPGDGFTGDQQLVALPLKPGEFPVRGLAPGVRVVIVATPGTATGQQQQPISEAQIPATVAESGTADPSTGVTVVDVRVAAAAGPRLAQLASTGDLAVILLPPGR